MSKQYFTSSAFQTKKLAKLFAQRILKNPPKKKTIVIGLIGDLGSGKTTFLQGFAKGLGIKERILSPTFIIMRKFKIPPFRVVSRSVSRGFAYFYHIDCYRIQKPKEILDLGFREIISDSKNIIAIEWADQIWKILPKDILIIKFKFIDKNTRKIMLLLKHDKETPHYH